jgi:polyhydroxyalkanoate synthesis regulator phasin
MSSSVVDDIVEMLEDESEEARSVERLRWTIEDLGPTLRSTFRPKDLKMNVCLFIDALDEHSGNHRSLLTLLKEILTISQSHHVRIKICLASRLENVFLDELGTYPGFFIHEHTVRDIYIYAQGRMQPELARRHLHQTREHLSQLVDDIVKKAQGVFVWVRLVVDELLEVISSVPSELEQLYQRALRRLLGRRTSATMNQRNHYETFVMFQIALRCTEPYDLATFFRIVFVHH